MSKTHTTETLAETASICGVRPDQVPTCRFCGERLTSNEFDFEPGTTPSFYSTHFRCQHSSIDGRYGVVNTQDGTNPHQSRRFHSELRAQEEAQYLARNNVDSTFYVVDVQERRTLSGWCTAPRADATQGYGYDADRVFPEFIAAKAEQGDAPRLEGLRLRQWRQEREVRRANGGRLPAGWEPTGTRSNPHWANND